MKRQRLGFLAVPLSKACRMKTVLNLERERVIQNLIKAGPPPLEAILVIFGRRALIFFLFESSWK